MDDRIGQAYIDFANQCKVVNKALRKFHLSYSIGMFIAIVRINQIPQKLKATSEGE